MTHKGWRVVKPQLNQSKKSTWAQLFKASLAYEFVSGQNVNCSSKYNLLFTGIFAEKKMWV